MRAIWLLLVVALSGSIEYGRGQTTRDKLLEKFGQRGAGIDCTIVIEGIDDWKKVDDPKIKAEVSCEGVELYNNTEVLSNLQTFEDSDYGFELFGDYRKLGKTYLNLKDGRRMECLNCTFTNLPAFPKSKGGSPAPVVIGGDRKVDFYEAKFKNNGGGYKLAGGLYITESSKLEIVDSTFEDCSGTNAGALDVDKDGKVDFEFTIFTNNVGKVYAGTAHIHDEGNAEFETCAFSGSPPPQEFVRYSKGEINELPEDIIVPNAGAISVNDDAVVQVDICDFSGHGGKMGTIHTTHEAWLLLDESKFEGNFGGNGGGVFIEGDKGHSVKMSDVNFTSNFARAGGGLVILGKGSVSLKNSFFETNQALVGGGIYSDFALPEQKEYKTCGKATEGTRITIEKTSFLNNAAKFNGGGMHTKCTLISVEGGIMRRNSAGEYGGGIYIETGVELDVEFTPFDMNTASKGGSGIYARNTTTVDVEKVEFRKNRVVGDGSAKNMAATTGGGTLAVVDSEKVVVTSSDFIDNEVLGSGGALWLDNVNELVINQTEFVSNVATSNGGALWADGVSESVLLNNVIVDNNIASISGGGFVIDNLGSALLSEVTFTNNTAGSSVGGLKLIGSGSLTTQSTIIEQNQAGASCGGFHIGGFEDVLLTDASVSLNRAASDGGGLCVENVGSMTVDKTVEVISNKAQGFGGGVHLNGAKSLSVLNTTIESNTGETGVSMNIENVGDLLIKDMSFSNNAAKKSCGAVRLMKAKKVEIEDVIFEDNEALESEGGALCVIEVDDLKLLGSTAFKNNVAKDVGGAISVHNSGSLDLGATNFEDNSARTGGAVGGLSLEGFRSAGAEYRGNSCKQNGGSIDLDAVQLFALDNVKFTSNTAGLDGGAVWLMDGRKSNITETVFFLNEAGRNGGGLMAGSSDVMELSSVTVRNNTAEGSGGGVIVAGVKNLRLLDTTLEYNTAKKYGGALELKDSKVDGSNLILKENEAKDSGGAFLCKGNSKISMDQVNFTHNFAKSGQSLATQCNCNVNVTDSSFHREKKRKGNGDFFDKERRCSEIVHSGCLFFGAPDRGWPFWLIIVVSLACTFGLLCCITIICCIYYRRRYKPEKPKYDEEAAYSDLDQSPKRGKGDYDDEYDDEYDDGYDDEFRSEYGSEYDDVDLSDDNQEDFKQEKGNERARGVKGSNTKPSFSAAGKQ